MEITARYASHSKWDASKISPESEVAYFLVKQNVIYRESLLIKLNFIAENLDLQYWKYAILRMKVEAKKQALNIESLEEMRQIIRSLQAQLTVVFANIRESSVSVTESIIQWRSTKAKCKSTVTKETISVFWRDENYLLKMRNDCENLYGRFYTIRLWLGFCPSSLLLSPLGPEENNLEGLKIARNNRAYSSSDRIQSSTQTSQSSLTLRQYSMDSLLLDEDNIDSGGSRTSIPRNCSTTEPDGSCGAKARWEENHFSHYLSWINKRESHLREKEDMRITRRDSSTHANFNVAPNVIDISFASASLPFLPPKMNRYIYSRATVSSNGTPRDPTKGPYRRLSEDLGLSIPSSRGRDKGMNPLVRGASAVRGTCPGEGRDQESNSPCVSTESPWSGITDPSSVSYNQLVPHRHDNIRHRVGMKPILRAHTPLSLPPQSPSLTNRMSLMPSRSLSRGLSRGQSRDSHSTDQSLPSHTLGAYSRNDTACAMPSGRYGALTGPIAPAESRSDPRAVGIVPPGHLDIDRAFEDSTNWVSVLKSLCDLSWGVEVKKKRKEAEKDGGKEEGKVGEKEGEKENDSSAGQCKGSENHDEVCAVASSSPSHSNGSKSSTNYDTNNSSSSSSSSGSSSASSHHNLLNSPCGIKVQGPLHASAFWSDVLLNPIIVEAAVGFYELYPLQPLIPVVPAKLYRKCVRIEEIIAEEYTVYSDLTVKAERAKSLKSEFERSLGGESVQVSTLHNLCSPHPSMVVLL